MEIFKARKAAVNGALAHVQPSLQANVVPKT